MAASNDPFEEFEFRPINEGLGFHRKQKTQAQNVQTHSQPATAMKNTTVASTTATIPTATKTASNTFAAPLPRQQTRTENSRGYQVPTIEDDSIAKAQIAVNEILKNLNQKRQTDFIYETEKQRELLKKSKPFFFAAMLDGMLITASFLLSMIAMLTITKVDLFLNLGHAESSKLVYVATIGLFLTITLIYMVVNRAFAGYTPGEWAFDQRCGQEEQMKTLSYIPRLVLRTIAVIMTGFVTLPLLSYLFNRDVAGQIAGVNLFRKSNA